MIIRSRFREFVILFVIFLKLLFLSNVNASNLSPWTSWSNTRTSSHVEKVIVAPATGFSPFRIREKIQSANTAWVTDFSFDPNTDADLGWVFSYGVHDIMKPANYVSGDVNGIVVYTDDNGHNGNFIFDLGIIKSDGTAHFLYYANPPAHKLKRFDCPDGSHVHEVEAMHTNPDTDEVERENQQDNNGVINLRLRCIQTICEVGSYWDYKGGCSGKDCCTKVTCPIHSYALANNDCQCDIGYEGTITWSHTDKHYSRACNTVVNCPANSSKSVDGKCTCNSGGTEIYNNVCQDINECIPNIHANHTCAANQHCKNEIGSFQCDNCTSTIDCDEDGNTCNLHNQALKCNKCKPGHLLNSITFACEQCPLEKYCDGSIVTDDCQLSTTTQLECEIGSSTAGKCLSSTQQVQPCTQCKIGFYLNNSICKPCDVNFTSNGFVCEDLNECLTDNGNCAINTTVCVNSIGGHSCKPCDETAFEIVNNVLVRVKQGYEYVYQCNHLDLSGCGLGGLTPGVFDNFTNATGVDLTNNTLTNVPPGVFDSIVGDLLLDFETRCSSIGFNIDDNGIITRKLGTQYDYLTKCENLYLSNANIKKFAVGCFKDFVQLTNVDFSFNSIMDLSAKTFGDFFADNGNVIEKALLNSNSINSLSDDFFNNMMRLSTINLSNNNLTYLSDKTFNESKVEQILDVNLNNNNIDCCSSEKAIRLLFQKNIPVDCILDNDNLTATPTFLNEKCAGVGNHVSLENDNNNIGLIVGVVVGVLVVIAISCCVGYYIYQKKDKDMLQGKSAMEFLDFEEKETDGSLINEYHGFGGKSHAATDGYVIPYVNGKCDEYIMPYVNGESHAKTEYVIPYVNGNSHAATDEYITPDINGESHARTDQYVIPDVSASVN